MGKKQTETETETEADETEMETEESESGTKKKPRQPRGNLFQLYPEEVILVGIDKRANGEQDGDEHILYDDRVYRPVSERMVLSIMKDGVIEPIVVRRDGEQFEVVAGRGRVSAAREANLRLIESGGEPMRIPAVLRRGSDLQMLGLMISENELRDNDDLVYKARKCNKLITLGGTEEECAVVFGVDKKTIGVWMSVLDCAKEVLAAVEAGKISASAATKLASLTRAEQKAKLPELIAAGPASTKTAAAIVKGTRNAKKQAEAGEGAGGAVTIVPPGKRLLNKVIEAVKQGAAIDDFVIKTLKWINGDLEPRNIKGLSKILNDIKAEEAKAEEELQQKKEAKAQAAREKKKTKDAASGKKAAPTNGPNGANAPSASGSKGSGRRKKSDESAEASAE